ncbi:hypothetical protein PPERSA_04590 [Pseudocohnilembus persalinus]|uniref:E3 ubiquitin-protein ligase CHIP n=1 Tax=Pseudocohnilembus persalinus TaxID=266149 RepID=A0A0V0QAG0_PSEPJ|nr:hypothetical protein PPERSA_04590 [Pseudocohnilembus persalinus]|eukprot:KRW99228.1 hypothetical protein PPERSA_04590 [Pseudocohnilembus persalinus]
MSQNLNSKTPTQWKDAGNEAFKVHDYDTAIINYSNAIKLDDTQSVFFSNRSRCYKFINEYEKAFKDAITSIELDHNNIKAHLLCGQLLAQMGKLGIRDISAIELAIKRMTKALTLCAGQNKQAFHRDLENYINRAKKLLWYKKRELNIKEKKELQQKLNGLIENSTKYNEEQKKQLKQDVISQIGDPEEPFNFEIPEYFCCKITFDFMKEPTMTSQGITYEKEHLFEHFRKNGHFDPVTRKPVRPNECVPNINLKQAIDEYLEKNPWCYEYKYGETPDDIEF